MPQLKRLLIACLAACSISSWARGGDANIATLRAVGPHVSDKIIRHLAVNAEPTVLRNAAFPDEQSTTPRAIITRLCGTVNDVYVAEAARANSWQALPLDMPLGTEAVKSFVWPACLYIDQKVRKVEVTVKSGDTAIGIYQAYTGGGGADPAVLSKFFDKSTKQLSLLKPGEKLMVPTQTITVPLVPRQGTAADLVEEIKKLDPKGTQVNEVSSVDGSIVMGMGAYATTASATGGCNAPFVAPFDAGKIALAYAFTMQTSKDRFENLVFSQVQLTVVDNGFFGARLRSDGADPFGASGPFSRSFFRADPIYTIATAIPLNEPILPINYSNNLEPGMESGHGTHVAGLVLGGPGFVPYRDKITGSPWAKVTILNVARGSRTLFKGAPGFLSTHLSVDRARRIVNMSIAHDGQADAEAGKTYLKLFEAAPETLFVVAAGNNFRKDVGDRGIFPAALGGVGNANVITVAAIESTGVLAPFSNMSSDSVDMGAPGCGIESWIAYDKEPTPMSGTSQAAPIVTFAAALLRSMSGTVTPGVIKARLIASGDLLPDTEEGRTAYAVKLNIPRAMLWLHDTLLVKDETGTHEYLGAIKNAGVLKCKEASGVQTKNLNDMISLKRNAAGTAYLFAGAIAGKVKKPCRLVEEDPAAKLWFTATHEIKSDGAIKKLDQELDNGWEFQKVQNAVRRTSIGEL